jgi:hypothetical protein
MDFKKCWPLLTLLSATAPLVSLTLPMPTAAQAQQAVAEQPGAQATATVLRSVTPTLLASPPQLTSDRQAALQAALARKLALGFTRPTGRQVSVTEPPDRAIGAAPDLAAALPQVPGNPFVFEVSAALNPSSASTIGEPSLAQTGGAVFYTGNWYAAMAKTANPGPADWKYIDPAADMPDFCCDQDAVADPGRDVILWTRLGGTRGRFLISESTNHGASFCNWEINPAQIGLGGTYDQPLMALSNNNVYISAQVFGPFRNVLLRFSLDALQDCPGTINYTWWDITDANGWGGLVSGATTTMYLGSHRGTNNSFRIFSQPENSGSLFRNDNNIPAFTFQNGNSNCPVSGTNPCARADSRVQAGWVRKGSSQTVGEVGFMWNAHEGGSFPWAYLEAATFREDTLAVTGRPLIAYSNTAVEYSYASPNGRGDLGLTTFLMGGSYFPDNAFYVADDYQGIWTFEAWLGLSNGGANTWGDYVRNRAYLPCRTGWSSAGYTLESGKIVPRLSVVSRQRDAPCIDRYLNAL